MTVKFFTNLDDEVKHKATIIAAARRETLTEIINYLLADFVAKHEGEISKIFAKKKRSRKKVAAQAAEPVKEQH